MFEQLKQLASQKLQEAMQSNRLDDQNTGAAAQEGAGEFLNALTEKLNSGGLNEIKELLNGGGDLNQNGLFKNLQAKLQNVLQNKGMNTDEAFSEAQKVAPQLINGLRDKFHSSADEDKVFDLNQLDNLFEGGAAGLFNKAKSLFK